MDNIYDNTEVNEEDGERTLKDTTTPVYYRPLQLDNGLLDPHTFVKFWQSELRMLTAIGIGPILDNKHMQTNSQPPYTLTNLVKNCFNDSTQSSMADSVRLKVFKKSDAPPSATMTLPPGNCSLSTQPSHTFYPIDRSIFFSFVYEVSKMEHLKEFKELNRDVISSEVVCPSQASIERGLAEENMKKLTTDQRMQDSRLRKLEKHPMVMLMQLSVWNEKVCCVPLNELNGFQDFFELYSLDVSIYFYILLPLNIICLLRIRPLNIICLLRIL